MERTNPGTNSRFFKISQKHRKFISHHFSELKNVIKNFVFLKGFMCKAVCLAKWIAGIGFFLGSRTKHQPQGVKSFWVIAIGHSVLGPYPAQMILSWCVRNTGKSGEILGTASLGPGCWSWLSLSLVLTWTNHATSLQTSTLPSAVGRLFPQGGSED